MENVIGHGNIVSTSDIKGYKPIVNFECDNLDDAKKLLSGFYRDDVYEKALKELDNMKYIFDKEVEVLAIV